MKKCTMGQLVFTRGVNNRVADDAIFSKFVLNSLMRYRTCDWGEMSEEDKKLNDEAIICGDRIFAAYIFPNDGTKIWIITEADRSATTVLFPDEY